MSCVVCPGSSHHHLFGDYVSSFSSLAATTVSFWGNDCVSSSSVFLYQVMFYNVVDYYYLPSRGVLGQNGRERKTKRMSTTTTTTTSIVLNLAVTVLYIHLLPNVRTLKNLIRATVIQTPSQLRGSESIISEASPLLISLRCQLSLCQHQGAPLPI